MNQFLARLAPLLLAVALVACQRDPGPPPLEGARLGGPFTLTDHNGRRVSDRDFADKYRLVYFGFASCPDVCPIDLQAIGAGLSLFEQRDAGRAARVQPLFFTVDPARDTPEQLRRYVTQFHPRLIGLTGSEAEIDAVARAYGIVIQRGQPSRPGANDYLVDHSRYIILYAPDGRPLVIVPHEQGPEGIADELGRWVR